MYLQVHVDYYTYLEINLLTNKYVSFWKNLFKRWGFSDGPQIKYDWKIPWKSQANMSENNRLKDTCEILDLHNLILMTQWENLGLDQRYVAFCHLSYILHSKFIHILSKQNAILLTALSVIKDKSTWVTKCHVLS